VSAEPPSFSGEPPPAARAIRAFVALPVPDALRGDIAETMRRLKRAISDVRMVRDDGVHVTLRFLGWTHPERLAALEEPLRAAASACPPLSMRIRGLGTFPERGSPRVLWLGLSMPPAAHALQSACEGAAVRAGFEAEPRAFQPHLTLGRWRERTRRPALPEVDLGEGVVDRLVLFRSQPRSSGSEYTPLSEFPLQGALPAVR
jgi:2'-5' RNA ligase